MKAKTKRQKRAFTYMMVQELLKEGYSPTEIARALDMKPWEVYCYMGFKDVTKVK